MTSVPPPPVPLPFSSGSGSATRRRDADFVAALARVLFFFAEDDARAEAPLPAIRRTVGLVALSVDFFLAAIYVNREIVRS